MKLIKNYLDLQKIRNNHVKAKIGLCHGVFDILHVGHVNHFQEAKKKVDILIVSITADKFVNKGPNKPYSSSENRAKILTSINHIDYVFINNSHSAEKVIKNLSPNFYFKGKDYISKDITGNLKLELKELKKNKGKIFYTKTKIFSSGKIFNQKNLFGFDKKKIDYLKKLSLNNNFLKISNYIDKINDLEINLIGEPIIDEYIYSNVVGLTSKDPSISVLKKDAERLPGGVLAIAKSLSKFVKKVRLFTYGDKRKLKKFIFEHNNIELVNLDAKLIIQEKSRIINSNRFEKLLQITNIFENKNIDHKNIINVLKKKKLSNLVIADFGIDLFNNKLLDYINNLKIKKYINVQTNSLNYGKNLFSKYKNFNYMSLDKNEYVLGLGKFDLDDNDIKYLKKIYKQRPFSVTLGKNGSVFYTKKGKEFCPVFVDKIIDTTGCGDAFFVITTLLNIINADEKFIPFLGNCYAGLHSQYVGNKKIPTKNELINYVRSLLNY